MRLFIYDRVTARVSLRLLSAILLLGTFSLPAWASGGLFSSVTPLTEPTPASDAYYGYAWNSGTAVSADGLTVLVASEATVGTASYGGKAYIYHFANGAWTLSQEIDDPDAAAGNNDDEFGSALALNADGTVALIGSDAYVNGQEYAGKAYVYTLSNGTWTQTHEFDDPAATAYDDFGATSVSLSADGKTAVIGSDCTEVNSQNCAGEAYIYTVSNGSWTQAAAIPDPDDAQYNDFSYPVSISGDGQSVLIGSEAAVNSQTYAGKAYLYTLSNGTWSQAKEFDDPAATSDDFFGDSGVALSSDGQTAVIGADCTTVNSQSCAGEAYIYTASNGSWTQAAAITDPDATQYDDFSFPVSISADGNSVLIGSEAAVNGQSEVGKAYLFKAQSNGSWMQTQEFDDPAATADDYFGESGVALSSDGEMAFISAPYTTVNSLSDAGAAYIYQSPDDVSLSLSATPASVTTGQNVTLDATITNTDSAVTAYNVVLTGTLPAGLSYANSSPGSGTCTASGSTVTCTLASLAPGATWQPSITGSASSTGTLTASATVASNEPDPTSSNNSATASVSVTAPVTPPSSSGGGGAFGLIGLLMLGLPLLGRRRRK